jgi:MFS family permease
VLYFAAAVFELVIMSVLLGAGLGAISLGTLTLASKATAGERKHDRGQAQEQERERSGKVMGIYYTAFYAGLGVIPLVCGALSEVFGARVLFLAYAVLLFVVMGVVWWMVGIAEKSV